MKYKLLDILACPACRGRMDVHVKEVQHQEIKEGFLKCLKCEKKYPVSNYIPRFVNSDEYVSNFSFEWEKHKRTQLDSVSKTGESSETFKKKTGIHRDLTGELVLDAGCGSGRFMEVALNLHATVVGMDLSYAVDEAMNNLNNHENAHFIQADINNPPFRYRRFDYIYSIGVLHHTPCTKDAFISLVQLLRPGGQIAIWVYSNEGWIMKVYNTISDFYRVFTTRMNKKSLYYLARVASNLYPIYKLPVLGHALRVLLPASPHPIKEWRVLDTFDWYSPKYQWKHTYKEVEEWFEGQGLKYYRRLDVPVAVSGRFYL